MSPSLKEPRSTRATESLPPWAVWIVFITCASGGPSGGHAEPVARRGHGRRFVAQRLQQAGDAVAPVGRAEQHRHRMALAQFLAQIVEHLVARRLDLLDQLFHQRVVVIGQAFQHREARFAFRREFIGGNGDDFARRRARDR